MPQLQEQAGATCNTTFRSFNVLKCVMCSLSKAEIQFTTESWFAQN